MCVDDWNYDYLMTLLQLVRLWYKADWNGNTIINSEQVGTWKKVAMAYFIVVSQH
jgi:hypothetical protein